ncbi:hypothetical protein TIFTF001_018436 [Ficus carica]|uniref:Transmembrane protein n=1 Tax=Ficus carica TaxID=3494 RepID=A0AA88AE04_FICCA|nr:hypothetical protein TIFTF001_018436 [Ficus carica]
MMRRAQQDQQSGVLYELSSLVLNILRSPPSPIQFSDQSLPVPAPPPPSSSLSRRSPHQISPAGFASLLLGISLALMLCGSVTFFIGFILMPWILGLVMVFYVVGIVSSLSMLGRSILCYATAPSNPQKEIPVLFVPNYPCLSWVGPKSSYPNHFPPNRQASSGRIMSYLVYIACRRIK